MEHFLINQISQFFSRHFKNNNNKLVNRMLGHKFISGFSKDISNNQVLVPDRSVTSVHVLVFDVLQLFLFFYLYL